MAVSESSQLQGAFRNYLNSVDSAYQSISENIKIYEKRMHILKLFLMASSAIVGYALIMIYSKNDFNLFINFAFFLAIWFSFIILLFRTYSPWIRMFHFCRKVHYSWRCPIVLTEDKGIQTEEVTACESAALHNTTDEQTVFQIDAQQDTSEERTAGQNSVLSNRISALFAFRKCLPLKNIFILRRICCCCLRSCYHNVSTADLGIQTDENAACQLAAHHNSAEEQTVHQFDRSQEQTPDTVQSMSDENIASIKLHIAEQRLLQYLFE